jgi:exopolysaccharide production protein ExoQ
VLYSIDRDISLTGRVPLWTAALDDFMQRPIAGYGYRTYWHSAHSGSMTTLMAAGWSSAPSHGHNVFIDIGLDLGIIGLVMMVVLLSLIMIRLLRGARRQKSIEGIVLLVFLLYILVFGVPGGELLTQNSIAWTLLVVIHVLSYKKRVQPKTTLMRTRNKVALSS